MMATTTGKSLSIGLKSNTTGKKRTQTVPYINPDASDTSIAEFGQLIADLQEDEVTEMVLIEKKALSI